MLMGFDDCEDNLGLGFYYLNYKYVLLNVFGYFMGLCFDLWFDYDKFGLGIYNMWKDLNDSLKYMMGICCYKVSLLNLFGLGIYDFIYYYNCINI